MLTRQEYEQSEQQFLAPYAMKSGDSEGREYPEQEHPYRTAFQRDRDRIIHSNAFRRLEYKTQVFVYHEGDHYRTRLTHSIEGAQIARTLARALRLNEDLSEAIILAHDLGHTPFGHSGEVVLNRLMKECGGYEHNRQSLRIVTLLEKRYPQFPGLNLTYEVREGLAKHMTTYDQPNPQASFKKKGHPTLEAQIVNLADEIAYTNHDLDDGIRSGLLNYDELKEITLWKEYFKGDRGLFLGDKLETRQAIRNIINAYVTDLANQIEANLKQTGVRSLQEVRESKVSLVAYSESFDRKNREIKKFLREKMYRHYRVERMADKAQRIIENLFKTYLKNPKILPPDVQARGANETIERVVCDYIAGMTDRFAQEEYQKLFDAETRV
ncbi:MAG: deoxyguanosinetriphosphate triphosphohydrolase [Deltaproteobacteria bacterium]|nr:deoxyguanosinetriphosphate triphosphohydrolase [Deltaproteobacteria bacterium]